MAEIDISSAPQIESGLIANEASVASTVTQASANDIVSADPGFLNYDNPTNIDAFSVHDGIRASEVSEGELFVEEAVTATKMPFVGEFETDRDYRQKTYLTTGGFKSSVQENILSHPVVLKNRSEPGVVSHISLESRQVMRKGFDLGIASPALRIMYDVRELSLSQ